MKLAFCLFKFFHYGGLARDFLQIAKICRMNGHEIDVYAMEWNGTVPDDFNVTILPGQGLTNHGRLASFLGQVRPLLAAREYDLVIGFNKMPGLDAYYAADPCYLEKVEQDNGWLYKLSRRFRFYADCEKAVFGRDSRTVSLLISTVQKDDFRQHYQTPDFRLHLLPPGVSRDRKPPPDALSIRQSIRKEFEISDREKLILMVGTGFKTKGLDRALKAFAALPGGLREQTYLFVLGEDDESPFRVLAQRLGVDTRVRFLGGRSDVPRFLLGADALVHPSYRDNTGTVILEALVTGLPVLATDVCGYACHVSKANAGLLVPSPFSQKSFNNLMLEVLTSSQRPQWSRNGLAYADNQNLYNLHEQAAALIEAVAEKKKVSA